MNQKIKKAVAIVLSAAVVLLFPVFSSAKTVARGDANADGSIDVSDARKALRFAVGLGTLTAGALKICDIDGNGKVDVSDARSILRHAVSLEAITASDVDVTDEELAPPSEGELLGDLSSYPLPTVPNYEKKSGYFTFVVYGDGHGVGLSQYGAVYMAQKGCTYQYILSHYFPGTIIRQDETLPETSSYVGSDYDTLELICRMVAQEIGGIQPPVAALEAQTIAIYTLLKKNNFEVKGKWDVATICDTSSWIWTNSWTQNTLVPTVLSVVGQYLALESVSSNTPVYSVYSRMAAGATVNCADEWYASYPVSVKSPFEMTQPDFVHVYQYSASELKKKLTGIWGDINLGGDPSTWIKILTHTASIDKNRGYVKDILVGDLTLSKVGAFSDKMGFESGCFTVEYTK